MAVTKKNFDKGYANKVSADEFVKQHAHLIDDKLTDEAELRGIHADLQDEKPKEAEKPAKSKSVSPEQ